MKRSLFVCAVLVLLTASPAVPQTAVPQTKAVVQSSDSRTAAASGEPQQTMVTTYCTGCHNSKLTKPAGGLALDTLNVQAAADHPEVWEKVIRKLRGRLMPPPGANQPEQKDNDTMIGFLENTIDSHSAGPKAGYVGIQRLSRTEYIAAIKALVGVDVKSKDILPQDVAIQGFDNIAAGLSVSPAFVEQYVEAARVIAKQAVGDPSLDSTTYKIAANRGAEAMPLGMRDGGMKFKHNFPADG